MLLCTQIDFLPNTFFTQIRVIFFGNTFFHFYLVKKYIEVVLLSLEYHFWVLYPRLAVTYSSEGTGLAGMTDGELLKYWRYIRNDKEVRQQMTEWKENKTEKKN